MKSIWQKWTACLLAAMMVLGSLVVGPGVLASAASEGSGVQLLEAQAEPGREKINFNNDWRYRKGDVKGAEAEDFSDEDWLYVNLPHSTIHYTPDNYYQKDLGVYWYRKHFTVSQEMQGQKLLLTFEAAMQASEVWINGESVKTHQGGYTSFVIDITDKVRYGEENVIAVRIDTRPNAAFAPGKTNPDFQYFGGLYRNVYITATDTLHISDAVYENKAAGGGIFLTAPSVTKESATVKAQTDVKNEGAAEETATVLTELIDEDGSVVAQKEDTQAVAAGESLAFVQELTVENPRLWSINTPELYTVRTTVKTGETVRDAVETTYGIRKVEWKREGCYINDEFVELSGTNLHSETGMLGNAQPDDAIFEEVRRLKEYGFDFIRMSHYPHAPAFYAACDKYGVAVIDCLSGWQNFANTDSFKNSTYQELRDMMHANRNYCSIVAWEPSLNESGYTQAWAAEVNRIAKEEYPADGDSRIYTSGWKFWTTFDMGVGTPQANVMNDAAKNPTMPAIVSEYGDWNYGGYTSSTRVTREPAHTKFKGGDEGMLIQCDNAQEAVAFNRSFEWGGAYAYWQYADYAGFDTTDLTYCGVVDIYRIPKFSAYFFQSQRDADVDLREYGIESGPMAFVANTWASDSPNKVRVFSNCDEVELFVDGVSVGKQTPDTQMWGPHGDGSHVGYPSNGKYISTENLKHPPFTFDLSAYTPGQGTLTAVGYINGEEAAEYVRKAPGTATKITLQAENDAALKLDGSTAKLVWINVEDANGTVVNTANNDITFSIDGPGLVIGGKETSVLGGQMGVWVRSKRGVGDITLTATADGLESAAITIPTETVEGLPAVPEGGDADESEYEQPIGPVKENLFLKKAVTASSENTSSALGVEAASRANDGDEATKWCAKVTNSGDSSVGPHWWQVDMGESTYLDQVQILFEMDTNYKYQIAISDSPDMTQADVVVDRSTNNESVHDVTEDIQANCRYVRVYVNCPASNIWPCLLEVRGFGGTTNVALGKTATATKAKADCPASLAVDGDSTTHWTNGATESASWQVDLDGTYQIDKVDVEFLWHDNLLHAFTLQGSMDGQNWKDITEYSGTDAIAALDVDAVARYLRVYNLTAGTTGKDWVEIAEFSAYGTPAADDERIDYGVPAYASSSAEGSDPSYGNDGDPAKYWSPAADDASPWWFFDAGGLYNMSNVQLSWNNEGFHKYTIDLSTDGENWTTAVDKLSGSEAGTVTNDTVAGVARYVRITLPAGSTEGFWINSTARENTAQAVATVAAIEAVSAPAGTAFADLKLPKEAAITLEDETKTTLSVTWDSTGYKPEIGSYTLSGTLNMMPGVKNPENQKASVVVNVTEKPKETVAIGMKAPETVAPGSSFTVQQTMGGLAQLSESIYVMQMTFTWPEGLNCTGLVPAEGLNGTLTYGVHPETRSATVVYDADTLDGLPADVDSLFTANFTAAEGLEEGDYTIALSDVIVLPVSGDEIGADLKDGVVHVAGQIAPETADLTATYSKNVELTVNGEPQRLADLIGQYKEAGVANGTPFTFAFAPRVAGKTFRSVTINGSEPQMISGTQYDYTFNMDTLNPNLRFAFELVSRNTLDTVIAYAQERIDAGDVDELIETVQTKFMKAFDAATDVQEDPTATQEQIDTAWKDLMKMLHYLEFKPGDKTDLCAKIATAETLLEENYTAASWSAMTEALEAAKAVEADDEALKNDIDKACEDLYKAMMALEYTVDRTTLDMLIAEAEQIDLTEYLEDGKDAFNKAFEAAKNVADDASQKVVDKAAEALASAIAGLRRTPDKKALEDLLDALANKDLSKYTDSSVAALKAAMNLAKGVLDDPNASGEKIAQVMDLVNEADKGLKTKTNNSNKGSGSSSGSGSSNAYGSAGTASATTSPVVNAAQGVVQNASVRSDTTVDFTLRRGSAYCFKMTVVNGDNLAPNFTVGNGSVLKTQFVAKIGNDYYYRVWATGKAGESTGVYTTLNGQKPAKHCTVKIG
ncbi:discoidin domain-containing protein [Anaeromassilibacillus senegalensis]|uniref:discoidin domain-containing protein n=1 Tax=Anaeromassilibacillus senegalensis TaxID=1673717 RepID=UPI0006815526|nr:discoidin domain-containing protein [Anaeromassilibacillus senegalensis]